MSRLRYILLVALVALSLVGCERRPIEEQYLKVYLDLDIDRNVTNYEVGEKEPGLMRVAFFDSATGDYLSHDFVSCEGGYIFAPYGEVDMVVYNLEAGATRVRNYYIWSDIEAYTNPVSEQQLNHFSRYLQSRVDTRPSYETICEIPGHLFVARKKNIYIPQHISEEVFVIKATAKSVVESWTVEIDSVTGMEWVGSVTMMISGQISSSFIATETPSSTPTALYFDAAGASRQTTVITSRFETFGREKSSGDAALLSILFTDVQGHPYMYNFDVSSQMENNPDQHIVIHSEINIPKPEVGGGFDPDVEDWKEFEYDIDI